MAGFGAKMPSAVGAEGKSLSPDPKRIAGDEARTSHGLPTPESTPGPDTARIEIDKARRQAEAAKAPSREVNAVSASDQDIAPAKADKGKGRAGPSSSTAPPDASPDGGSDKGERKDTNKQKNAVDRVLKCEPNKYYQVLGVKDPSPKEESKKAYKALALLLHPDKNKYKGAEEAFKRINTAAKALGVESEDFAENAYEDETDQDDGTDQMEVDQGKALKPDDFRMQVYDRATPYLGKLMEDPKDTGAKAELDGLNKEIMEQNLKDKLPKEELQNFLINVPHFTGNFELAKKYFEALAKDPADILAREKLTNINGSLDKVNELRGYPKSWLMTIPPQPGTDATGSGGAESSAAVASKAADQVSKSSMKGGVKTKVGVPIPDESDGNTSLGKVVYVRKAGHGSRVIVNRGTEENPYFDIHPGAAFGKGVAREWLEDKTYECEDLPKNTTAKQMTIYGRVKVERTTHMRKTKTGRVNSQIQYYLIKVGEQEFVSTRSALSGMKGLSPAKLQRIDAQLDHQNEQLLAELDHCREKREHPDTGEQLTSRDIEEMPWLSLDAIVKPEDDDSNVKEEDDDEDENIENIVPERPGLKRKQKPETASGIPRAPGISRNPTEAEL